MDEENEFEGEVESLPLTWADLAIPAIRVLIGAAQGFGEGMKSLNNALVSHSIWIADRKATRARNAADQDALKRTGAEIERLTVADFEEGDR